VAELIVPLHAPIERIDPVRSVRSTLLSGSIQALRARELLDQYFEELPREHHDAIRSMVAGVWVPLDLAQAHYSVLDRMITSEQQQLEMGRDVADRIHRTILATVARAATGAGATPWIALGMFPKLMERTFVGGGVSITKISPKDARLEVVRLSLLDSSPYFRNAFRGVIAGGIELFCRRAFVNDLSRRGDVNAFKMSWA
jgi:hypothetical protein